MNIKGSTNIVGLIGNPVSHSFSPPMHNAAFKHLNLDYVYVAFDVMGEKLENAIKGCEALNIKGLNVTIPHKIEVMKYLDELDEIAELIGAVNTLDINKMKGYNTDGIGAVKAIEEVSKIKNKKITIFGAGGASRAISFYLAKNQAESMTILNRDILKADKLVNDIIDSSLCDDIICDSLINAKNHVGECDILINTTPIGMHPNIGNTIVKAEDIHEDLVVFDAVYNPNETQLLKEAIKANACPVYGIRMLLYQGAESFKIWTGKTAPVDVMESALKKTLNLG